MVNDLSQLLRDNVADAPDDNLDLPALMRAGRRQVRRRQRRRLLGGASVALAGTVLAAVVGLSSGDGVPEIAGDPPRPDAPTLKLNDATRAVEGRDYRELASYTNENLDRANGQKFEGVTEDGRLLVVDGSGDAQTVRYGLMDPRSGGKDWLPSPPVGAESAWPAQLGADRVVLVGFDNGTEPTLFAYVFDRGTQQWSVRQWPSLPPSSHGDLVRAVMGPDDRLYVLVPNAEDRIRSDLWSASLSDQADVRDEGVQVGDLAFTDEAMVWTDATNDDPGMVHVRDLATGTERSFDPNTGSRCNLLSFGAVGDRIVMGQYCGTYSDGVRDDRVQVLSTDGDQVVTIQASGIDGRLDSTGSGSDVVTIVAEDSLVGTYAYDLSTGRLLRISDEIASWGREVNHPAGPDQFFWYTPEGRHGATQHLGQLLP